VNNYNKIQGVECGDWQVGDLLSCAYNDLADLFQFTSELGTGLSESVGKAGWIFIETEKFNCIDSYLDECREEVDRQGVMGFWDNRACDPKECQAYDAASTDQLPAIVITNPVCWPEDECNAVCKLGPGKCWSKEQPADCEDGRHYCYADPANIDLGVAIGGVTRVRDIGSYIALLYNYLVGTAVILAIVMSMYGGFRWVTAAGSPEKITQAKQTIVASIIGLVIALFSYTILNTINPALVRLEMPPIKRIRSVAFEISPVRCQDYYIETECKQNKFNFNDKYGGCQWASIAGFGAQCTIKEREPGQPGSICKGGKCDEGWCLEDEFVYAMGPIAGEYAFNKHRWCTDGTMDMPCYWDTDCKAGYTCDDNLNACVPTSKNKPSQASCDDDSQCSSGFCSGGTCLNGHELTTCVIGGESDCATGQNYSCVEFAKDDPSYNLSYCCPAAAAERDGHRCYIGCTLDRQCGSSMFCWKPAGVTGEGGSGKAIFVSESGEE
jgi:hypothetical protein